MRRWIRYPGQTHILSLVVALVSLVSCGLYWQSQEVAHQKLVAEATAQAERRALQVAGAVAGQIDALMRSFDVALHQLRQAYVNQLDAFDGTVRSVIESYPSDAIANIQVLNAEGWVTYSSSGTKEKIYNGNQEYFSPHAQCPDDRMFIGKPIVDRIANAWVITLTRGICKDGKFGGVVVTSLRPSYVARHLKTLILDSGDVIALIRADSEYLARSTLLEKALGTRVASDRPFLKGKPGESGIFRRSATIAEGPRLFAWQRLKDWPLIIASVIDERTEMAALVANHNAARIRSAAVIALVIAFSLGIASLLAWLQQRKLELQTSEEQLRRYKNNLEETVEQRTAELLLARDAAEAANKAKSVFLANMSHELRTPLNAILGFSTLMSMEEDVTTSQRATLGIINRSGEHLLGLINDVLEMAKIEAGRLQIESAPFDMPGLARDVADMMRLRTEQRGVQLALDVSPDVPRHIIGDEGRLRQILTNLVGNAVKFTDAGSITIRLGVIGEGERHLRIEVEDTGSGIAPEDQKRLFQPFVQLATSEVQKGTGLGLAITRNFVQLMGGQITLESTLGKGTVFRVVLPLKVADEGDGGAGERTGTAAGEVCGLAPGQPAWRILIAEDQLENQMLLTKLMTGLGLDTRLATNGAECVSIFQEWHPHLIWMDRRMPVVDGLEATRRIRALPDGQDVKIVAVTASVFGEQRQELLSAGMNNFVRKPYRFSEIHDCLARQLGVKYVYRAPAPGAASLEALTPEMLAALPAATREELRLALECLDTDRIGAVIDSISETNVRLARTLLGCAERFDYPTILTAMARKA